MALPSSSSSRAPPPRIGARPEGTRSVTRQHSSRAAGPSVTLNVTITVSAEPITPAGRTVRTSFWPFAGVRLDGSSGPTQEVTASTDPDTGSSRAVAACAGVSTIDAGWSGWIVSSCRAPSTVTAATAGAPATRFAHPCAASARSSATVVVFGGLAATQASMSAATGSPSDAATMASRAVCRLASSPAPGSMRTQGPCRSAWLDSRSRSMERAKASSPA